MNLTKEKKSDILEKLRDKISRSKAFVIAEYQGTKVSEIEEMRKDFYESGLDFQVAKNTLFKKALDENKIEIPSEIFDKPITICWGYDDEATSSKKISGFAKKIETVKPLGVVLNGKFYDAEEVKALANMPGREQLLAQLLGTMNAPVSNFVYVLKANFNGLVKVLDQIKSNKAA